MTKAYIHHDEIYMGFVDRVKEGDDFPRYYLPVEVPDDLLQRYDDLWHEWNEVRKTIIETCGESQRNPDYEAEWEAFKAQAPRAAGASREKPVSEWAEYLEDL